MLLVFKWGIPINEVKETYNSKKKWIFDFMAPLLYSIVGASIGGATMAVLNVLMEMARGDSIFGFRDIFVISLWYMVIWVIAGTNFGIICAIFFALRKKRRAISVYHFIYVCTFIACWLLSYGYLNILFFAGFVNAASIILSLVIILIGIILFFILLKKLKRVKARTFRSIIRFQIVFLIIIILISLISNKILLDRHEISIIPAKRGEICKYNIILIVLDAVRYDHLSCYGYKSETTPNIDSLAEEGALFENAYAPSSHTIESVPSLFTSCYPSTHNVKIVTSSIPQNLLMLPEIFKAYGYKTSLFSVNPFVSLSHGYNRGVDDFFGLEENVIKIDKTVLGFQLLYFPIIPMVQQMFKSILKFSYSLFLSEASFKSVDPISVTQKVKQWLMDKREDPFFIYIHYDGGHTPYNPPESYWRLFDPNYQGKPVSNFTMGWGNFLPFLEGKQLPERDLDNMIARYDGEIFYHDYCLGQLFKHIEKLDLSDKTIIVITADHGEEFYEHNGWSHGHSLFEETVHVPLIFWCPGLVPKAKRVLELVSLVDVFPTILTLCGVEEDFELPYAIDGVDLSPFILDIGHKPKLEFIFSEFYKGKNFARCIRTENFKAIDIRFGLKNKKMLFDLERDPRERNNIYDEKKQVGRELFKKIDILVKRAEERSFKPQKAIADEKLKEWLRTLGYIK